MAAKRLVLLTAVVLAAMIVPTMEYCLDFLWRSSAQVSKTALEESLDKEGLKPSELEEIFRSVSPEDAHAQLGGLSVTEILVYAKNNGLSNNDCRDEIILERLESTDVEHENIILNAYNFANINNEVMRSLCADHIRSVFGDKRHLAELNDKKLAVNQIRSILSAITFKRSVKIGLSNVKEILDQEQADPSLEDCKSSELAKRGSYIVVSPESRARTLHKNVAKFGKASFRKVVQFCVNNIKQVFELRTTAERRDDFEKFAKHFKDKDEVPSSPYLNGFYARLNIASTCDGFKESIENVKKIAEMSKTTFKWLPAFEERIKLPCSYVPSVASN